MTEEQAEEWEDASANQEDDWDNIGNLTQPLLVPANSIPPAINTNPEKKNN